MAVLYPNHAIMRCVIKGLRYTENIVWVLFCLFCLQLYRNMSQDFVIMVRAKLVKDDIAEMSLWMTSFSPFKCC